MREQEKSAKAAVPRARRQDKSRAEHVYEHLRAGIRNGLYGGGQRIREEEVAERLGVSRTPVREAIARLQSRGLIEPAAGGLVVVELSARDIMELYAVREMVESSAARFAAQHASSWEIENLGRIAQEFEAVLDDPDKLARVNEAFHAALYLAAHNKFLTRVIGELHDHLALIPHTVFAVPGRGQGASAEHRTIVDGIAARDPDAAEAAARMHLRHAQDVRLRILLG